MSDGIDIATSVLIEAAILFVVVVGVILIAVFVIWRLKNILMDRLPKPFLGDGPNVAWGEIKRAELSAGNLDPHIHNGPIAEAEKPHVEPDPSSMNVGNPSLSDSGSEDQKQEPVPSIRDDKQMLLDGWLNESTHSDDDWAERLLDKNRSNEEH